MGQEDNPPEVLDPDFRSVFDYTLDDLADVGVMVAQEQAQLLEQCIEGPQEFALTIEVLDDICHPYGWAPPEIGWDVNLGQPRLFVYPRVVQLDWGEMYKDTNAYSRTLGLEKYWRRFPSLPGMSREVSPWYDAEEMLGAYTAFRIWNLWPLDASLVELVEEAVLRWYESDDYQLLETYAQAGRGDFDLCDLASSLGHGDEDNHEHITDEDGVLNWPRCKTGEQAFAELEERLLVNPTPDDPDSTWWLRWFPGPRLPAAVEESWSSLLVSSEANSLRAVDAFPPWKRDELLRTERIYSPWLWLC